MDATRLLMTADAVGGVWQYALELADGLRAHGVETVLAVLGPPPSDAQRAEVAAVPGLRLIETDLPLDWLCADATPVLAAGEAVAALARDVGADLVHLNMPTLAARADFAVPVLAVTHGCVSTWWEAAFGTPLGADYRWHRTLMREGLHAADLTAAPSASFSATVARHYDLPVAPQVVHNGRAPLALPPHIPRADYAFTAGRLWDQVKGTGTLAAAAARLSVPFYAAGAAVGPHGEAPAIEHLQLLGHLREEALALELAARPVFVSAARFEPFGLAVLEAAAAGCPLVLSDIDTFRELWDGAALFVAPYDDAGFAAAIERILGDAVLRERMGSAACERAARYTPHATAARMAALYAQLLSQSPKKAAA